MKLNKWKHFIGKQLTCRTELSTSLYYKEIIVHFTVADIASLRQFCPQFFVQDLTFSGAGENFIFVPEIWTLAENNNHIHGIGPGVRKTAKATMNCMRLVKINNVKIVKLFGPDIDKWPLNVIKLVFGQALLDVPSTDKKFKAIFLDNRESKEHITQAIQYMRANYKKKPLISFTTDRFTKAIETRAAKQGYLKDLFRV